MLLRTHGPPANTDKVSKQTKIPPAWNSESSLPPRSRYQLLLTCFWPFKCCSSKIGISGCKTAIQFPFQFWIRVKLEKLFQMDPFGSIKLPVLNREFSNVASILRLFLECSLSAPRFFPIHLGSQGPYSADRLRYSQKCLCPCSGWPAAGVGEEWVEI